MTVRIRQFSQWLALAFLFAAGRLQAGETQLTHAPCGHILTNANCWSPDSRWIAYDTRSDLDGTLFDSTHIERVNAETGAVELLYEAKDGAHCGIVTYHPTTDEIVFTAGSAHPSPDWEYNAFHRHGLLLDVATKAVRTLDARDLTPPFTPGALRGGTHLHIFSPDARFVCFTYEDSILAEAVGADGRRDLNQRNVGVTVLSKSVMVNSSHPRNQSGGFSVLVTSTVNFVEPRTDEIGKAYSEAWVGTHGYIKPGGSRQTDALAFLGDTVLPSGQPTTELFLVDLPEKLNLIWSNPLQGTIRQRPGPPAGAEQRRLTFTENRKFPGVQGPRHWVRSSPNGSRIACLMKDDAGIVQLFTVSPNGGPPVQLTHNSSDVSSAFTWSPDGAGIAHMMDGSVCLTHTDTGETSRLTPRSTGPEAPRPEACVFSPDGRQVAFVRHVPHPQEGAFNQIFIVSVPAAPAAGATKQSSPP